MLFHYQTWSRCKTCFLVLLNDTEKVRSHHFVQTNGSDMDLNINSSSFNKTKIQKTSLGWKPSTSANYGRSICIFYSQKLQSEHRGAHNPQPEKWPHAGIREAERAHKWPSVLRRGPLGWITNDDHKRSLVISKRVSNRDGVERYAECIFDEEIAFVKNGSRLILFRMS